MRIEKYKITSNDREALAYYLQMVEATADGTKTIVETTETMTDVDGEPVTMEYYELVDYEAPQKSEEEIRSEEISRLKAFLSETDYIAIKMSEALALGEDTSSLVNEYRDVISQRAEARIRINELEG